MAFPLTEEQKRIVDDRGGELLVSAAAGSGKTRVLVERLMDRVTREGLDLDQFLVITYTKAAAGELRARIAQELSARLAEAPNDRHLRRQTALVYQAQISTIHAFCAALLRESGHLLDLDPDFRLCDEGEGHVMMAQVLEDVLRSSTRASTQRGTLPFWWTPSPPDGTTAAWPRSCWMCLGGSRATRSPCAGWRSRRRRGSWRGSPMWARLPGGRCFWRMPPGCGGTASAAWSRRWGCAERTSCWSRTTHLLFRPR